MPISESDPRVFFAAERTLLAWLRTGLTTIALGFVVSRFGLFLQLLAIQTHGAQSNPRPSAAAALGLGFVVVGDLAIILAAVQHHRFIATLRQQDLPASYSKSLAIGLSLVVGALGIVLAAYLFVTQP